MGFFKKIFKPVAKVFDKIIPNEIKPALPYLAAFAPMMMPASFGIGSLGPMMSRGLMSGGLNIGAQLAQEGNEGDINALSALLAGGVGALSAPGAGNTLRGGMTEIPSPGSTGMAGGELGIFGGVKNSGLEFLAKGADKLSGINAAGAADPFSMAGLKAAAIPFAQGTGDLMYAEGDRAMKDYEKALLDYENSLTEGQFATDAGRRAAIISAMTAGQHSQQVIDDTLAELGLRNGGIISLQNGGRVNFRGGGMDAAEPDFGEEYIMIEGEDGPIRIKKSDYESMPGMFTDTTTSLYGDASRGRPVPDFTEENNEPDFGGIKEAIENVDIKEKGENLEDVGKLIESSDESILRKFLTSKLVQEGRYALSEFLMNDPILFGTPDKFKDGKNNKRGTFKRDSSEYDKLSKEKQAYIEAFLNSDEGQLFLKPGKIRFPINEKMREHNKKIRLEDFNEDRNPLETLLGIDYENRADGGIMNGYNMGGNVLPQGMEMDYRGGGFIPMGSKERADDVKARVSKNEFVMTADAVRAAGGGSVNQGAKRMYELMNNLEARA